MRAEGILSPLVAPYLRPRSSKCALNELVIKKNEQELSCPVYYSELMVRADSPFQTISDLQGSVFAYNDRQSLSGFHCVEFMLEKIVDRNSNPNPNPFFSKSICTGSHMNSIDCVIQGNADVCALDCGIRANLMQTNPDVLKTVRPLHVRFHHEF